MSYIVSARKYRPTTFDTVVGQTSLTTTLKNAIATHHLAHAYLFCGPRGVGKTTCARIFAKTINCLHPSESGEACNECESCVAFNEQRSYNIIELDAASNNGIEEIRQLIDQTRVPPQIGKYKVFIIDEVHMLSTAAFNAFLKTLEEPPSYVIFILATTEKHKILPTILSRCQIYDFNRMEVADIIRHLQHVAQEEGITCEESALNVIAQKADGGMRDALSIFDQVASFCQGNITYQKTIANLNVLDYDYFFRITDLALESKIPEILLLFDEIQSKGFNAGHFVTGLNEHFRNLLVSHDAQTLPLLEASEDIRQRYQQQAQRCPVKFIIKAMKLCNQCDLNYKQSKNKKLLVELTLIQVAQLNQEDDPSSGLGPTKILKTIFKRAAKPAPASRQSSAEAGTSLPTKDTRHEMPASSQAIPARPSTPATDPSKSTSAGKSLTFSIRGIANDIKKESHSQATLGKVNEETEVEENQPFNVQQLRVAWSEYAQLLPVQERMMAGRLANLTPDLISDTSFEVVADNPTVLQDLNKYKRRIEEHLRQKLHNSHIEMILRERQEEDHRKAYSPVEQVQQMCDRNPAMRLLLQEFGLTLN